MINRLLRLQGSNFATHKDLLSACNDSNFKHELEALAKHFLHRKISGCSNCYSDAYIELKLLKKDKMKQSDFKLKQGAILRDKSGAFSKTMTHLNTTNDLALYHIRQNSKNIELFDSLPTNLEELLQVKKTIAPIEKVVRLQPTKTHTRKNKK